MDTYTIESNDREFYVENSETFEYERAKSKGALSIRDLYKILTDIRNESISGNFRITNSKQEEVSFEINDNKLILKKGNKIEKFDPSILNTTITTISGNSKKIEVFSFSKNKTISEEIINNENNSREYTEFHKTGNIKLKMQTDDEKQNYTLEKYDKDNNLIETLEPSLEDDDDFEDLSEDNDDFDYSSGEDNDNFKDLPKDNDDDFEKIKNNYILSHKKGFNLNDECLYEKDFRNLGIPTNVTNNSFGFEEPFNKATKNEIENAVDEFVKKNGLECPEEDSENLEPEEEVMAIANLQKKSVFRKNFEFAKNMEFLKKNSSSLKIIEKKHDTYSDENNLMYSVGTGEETKTFEIRKMREFNDKDKLDINVCKNGKIELRYNGSNLKPKAKYYFTVPNKDGSIYLFTDGLMEHHSNFPWNKERNPNFSVIAAGYFTVDKEGKISEISNDSGHFKPIAKDNSESFLRTLAKNMFLALDKASNEKDGREEKVKTKKKTKKKVKKKSFNINDRSISELFSKNKRVNGGYKISEDVTTYSTSVISDRKLDLIDRNARSKVMSIATGL